jgi:hypothetical protein
VLLESRDSLECNRSILRDHAMFFLLHLTQLLKGNIGYDLLAIDILFAINQLNDRSDTNYSLFADEKNI